MFDTDSYEKRMQAAIAHFEEESKKIRTGRAHPSMLEGVVVQAYGAPMPLNQVGNVVVADSQMLQVTPFDPGTLQAVVTAIRETPGLDLNPSDDGRIVRVPIPSLTTERRQAMVKQLGEKVEEARVALRNIRHDGLKDAKNKKDSKELSEDDYKRVEKTFEKLMSDTTANLEATAKAKEQEVIAI